MIELVIGAVIGFFFGVWCTDAAYESATEERAGRHDEKLRHKEDWSEW